MLVFQSESLRWHLVITCSCKLKYFVFLFSYLFCLFYCLLWCHIIKTTRYETVECTYYVIYQGTKLTIHTLCFAVQVMPGDSTPFQLTVDKLEAALQDAKDKVRLHMKVISLYKDWVICLPDIKSFLRFLWHLRVIFSLKKKILTWFEKSLGGEIVTLHQD